MTLQQFVTKFKGKKVNYNGHDHCVNLVRQYFKDVWNLPKQPENTENAIDFFLNHMQRPLQRQMCICIAYEKGLEPPPGAVVIFDASNSDSYGHIGICFSTQPGAIMLFEQDNYRRDGAGITRWSYDRVLGWLIKNENL
jgi:hypothetical protein